MEGCRNPRQSPSVQQCTGLSNATTHNQSAPDEPATVAVVDTTTQPPTEIPNITRENGRSGTAGRSNLRQSLPTAPPRRSPTMTLGPTTATSGPAFGREILQLCGGPDTRTLSMFDLFSAVGMGCSKYYTANGPQCDFSDNITFAQMQREVSEGELRLAPPVQNAAPSPNCITFQVHLH